MIPKICKMSHFKSLWIFFIFLCASIAQAVEIRLVAQEPLPVFELLLHIPGAGFGADSPGKSGTAALLRAVMDEGDLVQEAAHLGAVRSSDVDADGVTFRVQGLTADRKALVTLLWKWVFGAPMLQDQTLLAPVQTLLAEKHLHLRDDPEAWAMAALNSVLWRGTAYESGPIAELTAFKQLKMEDLRVFHSAHFRPERAQLLVLSGPVEGDLIAEIRAQVGTTVNSVPERFSANLKSKQRTKAPQEPQILHRQAAGPALLYWGTRVAVPRSSEEASYWVANSLLGEGSASRLARRVRDAGGMAYAIQSGFQVHREGWAWVISAATPNQMALPLLKKLRSAVSDLRKGPVEDQEFQTAKESALGRLHILKANPRAWAYRSIDVPRLDALLTEIPKVRVEDVLRVLNRAFAESFPYVVIVGDKAVIQKGKR